MRVIGFLVLSSSFYVIPNRRTAAKAGRSGVPVHVSSVLNACFKMDPRLRGDDVGSYSRG